jgi:hypothetical protein
MIDWEIGDEHWQEPDDQRQRRRGAQQPAGPRRRTDRRLVIALVVVVGALAAAAGALKWTANRNLAAVRADIQTVLDDEMWARETGNWNLYASLLDSSASQRWLSAQHDLFDDTTERGSFAADISDIALAQPDLALTEVEIEPPVGGAYRETRAYRRMGSGWHYTTAPHDQRWLHQVVRETDNLRFIYHAADGRWLAPIIPVLQSFYGDFLKDLSLSPLPNKRELYVVGDIAPADPMLIPEDRLYDQASLSSEVPIEQRKRSLGMQLAANVLDQFYAPRAGMPFLLDGVREWEVSRRMNLPDRDSASRVRQALNVYPFIPLGMIHPTYLQQPLLTDLAETVVDYLVSRQGRPIRTLVKGAQQSARWSDLVEMELELPYEDVDQKWWDFVVRRHGSRVGYTPDDTRSAIRWLTDSQQRAAEGQDRDLLLSLLDPEAPDNWRAWEMDYWLPSGRAAWGSATVKDWGRAGDGAWALLEPGVDSVLPARLVQFYRWTDTGRWYVTTPDSATGPPQVVATTHFQFRYREPDAADGPAPIPDDVDALYNETARDLGLGAQAPENLTVEFMYTWGPDLSVGRAERNLLRVLSPRLIDDPAQFQYHLGWTVTDLLLVDIAGLPSGRVLDLKPVYGIGLWEARRWVDDPAWNAQVVRQIHHSLQENGLPALARREPATVYITVAEYVVEAYGRDRFAAIVAAALEHDDVHTLIPAALGVDYASFESSWQAYVSRTYGQTPTDNEK